jgi:hypothetical protein
MEASIARSKENKLIEHDEPQMHALTKCNFKMITPSDPYFLLLIVYKAI